MTRAISDLTATAYHEAGHAIITLSEGLEVERIEINADRTGRCIGAKLDLTGDNQISDNAAHTDAMISFAGPLAQARWERKKFRDVLFTDGICDFGDFVELAVYVEKQIDANHANASPDDKKYEVYSMFAGFHDNDWRNIRRRLLRRTKRLALASDTEFFYECLLDHARYCIKDARQLLADYWPLVERVAAALVERRTLTGDELAALVPELAPYAIAEAA